MAKKTYEAFPGTTCEYLRNLAASLAKLEKSKKRMTEARDKADDELGNINEQETKKRTQLEADYGHAARAIKQLNRKIAWCLGEMRSAVEKADEAELFSDVKVRIPDFNGEDDETPEPEAPKGKELFDGKTPDPKANGRPVGRRGPHQPAEA